MNRLLLSAHMGMVLLKIQILFQKSSDGLVPQK